MSTSEYAVMFVLVAIMGAGIPGPGDASLIAAGALAGEGKLNIWLVLATAGLPRYSEHHRARRAGSTPGTRGDI